MNAKRVLVVAGFALVAACSNGSGAAPPAPTATPTTNPGPATTITTVRVTTTVPATTTEPVVVADGYRLVWSDEFEGPAGAPPNPEWWNHEIGGEGWGNQELEYYTSSTRNASLDGEGNLAIVARAEPAPGDALCWYGPCRYTSARLTTEGKVEPHYGKIEARIRVPFGRGMWPAFWMLGNDIRVRPWPLSGEIDIMENVGHEPKTVHGSAHGPGYSGGNPLGGSIAVAPGDLADDFHEFSVEWDPEAITWWVDGVPYARATPENVPTGEAWVFDHPFFIILNVAVGGQWPGDPDESTVFPQTMLVDWVRVWERIG